MHLTPIDDLLFRKMAEDIAFCQEILRVILCDPLLIVLSSLAQWDGKNLQGRSVILDCKCTLGDGRNVNVEVQKANDDDHQRRVRYNGAILTTNSTETGIDFKNIPDVCVIFIAKFDIFGKSLPVYHIQRTIKETGDFVDNGFEEIYVNALVRDGSEISELMEVFTEQGKYNDKFPVTSAAKHRFTETEEGVSIMCEVIQEIAIEEREETTNRMFRLNDYLMNNNRYEDWKRASTDKEFLKELFEELEYQESAPV